MVNIWTPETRFGIWFEIEAHATDALAALGVVPKEAAAAIWDKGAFEVARIDAIEAEVKYDVIAFLTNVAEHVGEPARFMHQGMTIFRCARHHAVSAAGAGFGHFDCQSRRAPRRDQTPGRPYAGEPKIDFHQQLKVIGLQSIDRN